MKGIINMDNNCIKKHVKKSITIAILLLTINYLFAIGIDGIFIRPTAKSPRILDSHNRRAIWMANSMSKNYNDDDYINELYSKFKNELLSYSDSIKIFSEFDLRETIGYLDFHDNLMNHDFIQIGKDKIIIVSQVVLDNEKGSPVYIKSFKLENNE